MLQLRPGISGQGLNAFGTARKSPETTAYAGLTYSYKLNTLDVSSPHCPVLPLLGTSPDCADIFTISSMRNVRSIDHNCLNMAIGITS